MAIGILFVEKRKKKASVHRPALDQPVAAATSQQWPRARSRETTAPRFAFAALRVVVGALRLTRRLAFDGRVQLK